jgi:hypothetical protein
VGFLHNGAPSMTVDRSDDLTALSRRLPPRHLSCATAPLSGDLKILLALIKENTSRIGIVPFGEDTLNRLRESIQRALIDQGTGSG